MGDTSEGYQELKIGQKVYCNISVWNIMPSDYPEIFANLGKKEDTKKKSKVKKEAEATPRPKIGWSTNQIYGPITAIEGDLVTVIYRGKDVQLQSIYWSTVLF